jgi:hypothetical protein
MSSRPLRELAQVIRSKNAKPYRLTLDVIFNRRDVFEFVKASGALTNEVVAAAYGLPPSAVVSSFVFDPGMAFKFTLRRSVVQGAIGDSDIYGAQQHAPLLDIPIPWSATAPVLDSDARPGAG